MVANHLRLSGVCIAAPGGRKLIVDLHARLELDRVAIIGRNGVGKSLLLEVLAGHASPQSGRVDCRGTRQLVRQKLEARTFLTHVQSSPGELRRLLIAQARERDPDFLLLDEPSQDLDEGGIRWLIRYLESWPKGLVVVSHDRRLLRRFEHFCVVEERGCRLFSGSFAELMLDFERRAAEASKKYTAELERLLAKEQHNAAIRRRRERKKAGGRVRELGRCPARMRLNAKRAYAQVYQAKREGVREQGIRAAREWARAARRSLTVELPVELAPPEPPARNGRPVVELSQVGAVVPGRTLFSNLTLAV